MSKPTNPSTQCKRKLFLVFDIRRTYYAIAHGRFRRYEMTKGRKLNVFWEVVISRRGNLCMTNRHNRNCQTFSECIRIGFPGKSHRGFEISGMDGKIDCFLENLRVFFAICVSNAYFEYASLADIEKSTEHEKIMFF